MRTNGYQNYFDDEVLAANPLKLVQLLYRGALDSIASARRFLRSGDIPSRSRAVSKTMMIVTELSLSLNRRAGGEFSQTLADLYDYVQKLLIQANSQQIEPPLIEAERLLSTLLEAWMQCEPAEQKGADQLQPTAQHPMDEPVRCAF
jgi:flagellar protein FliS